MVTKELEAPADGFPELDDAARRRAEERIRNGADVHVALATESVLSQITGVYR